MKRTLKYNSGKITAMQIGMNIPFGTENEELYESLEKKGYWWNGKNQAWEKESTRPSSSIFSDKKGNGTGIANIRLMCNPDETDTFLQAIQSIGFWEVVEISEKSYANRNGAGERTYIQVKRK